MIIPKPAAHAHMSRLSSGTFPRVPKILNQSHSGIRGWSARKPSRGRWSTTPPRFGGVRLVFTG
jgi:hypothetical protein